MPALLLPWEIIAVLSTIGIFLSFQNWLQNSLWHLGDKSPLGIQLTLSQMGVLVCAVGKNLISGSVVDGYLKFPGTLIIWWLLLYVVLYIPTDLLSPQFMRTVRTTLMDQTLKVLVFLNYLIVSAHLATPWCSITWKVSLVGSWLNYIDLHI